MNILKFIDGALLGIGLMLRFYWRRLRGKPELFTQYVDKSELKKWAELSRKK